MNVFVDFEVEPNLAEKYFTEKWRAQFPDTNGSFKNMFTWFTLVADPQEKEYGNKGVSVTPQFLDKLHDRAESWGNGFGIHTHVSSEWKKEDLTRLYSELEGMGYLPKRHRTGHLYMDSTLAELLSHHFRYEWSPWRPIKYWRNMPTTSWHPKGSNYLERGHLPMLFTLPELMGTPEIDFVHVLQQKVLTCYCHVQPPVSLDKWMPQLHERLKDSRLEWRWSGIEEIEVMV